MLYIPLIRISGLCYFNAVLTNERDSYVCLLSAAIEIIETPFFDDISPRNVTTVVDDTVVLKCRVKNKGNRTVSTTFNCFN